MSGGLSRDNTLIRQWSIGEVNLARSSRSLAERKSRALCHTALLYNGELERAVCRVSLYNMQAQAWIAECSKDVVLHKNILTRPNVLLMMASTPSHPADSVFITEWLAFLILLSYSDRHLKVSLIDVCHKNLQSNDAEILVQVCSVYRNSGIMNTNMQAYSRLGKQKLHWKSSLIIAINKDYPLYFYMSLFHRENFLYFYFLKSRLAVSIAQLKECPDWTEHLPFSSIIWKVTLALPDVYQCRIHDKRPKGR